MLDLPEGFEYLNDPRMIVSMNYATSDNFVGRPIHGYEAKVCILTNEAIDALTTVQDHLDKLNKGYALKLFDCYRPTRAIRDFIIWSESPEDPKMREKYHPYFSKIELFEYGYINEKSTHSSGSTVDLTIAIRNGDQHTDLDMGTIFDFFGEESHTESKHVSLEAQQHRRFLCDLMEKYDFENFQQEWWHYRLIDEPFAEEYFDFLVR